MDKIIYIRNVVIRRVNKFKPRIVYIEGQSYASRGRGTLSLAQLHGVIMYCLMKIDVPYLPIPPSEVKKYITGKGNAKKSLILKYVYKKYDIDVDSEDEADAIAVLLTGIKKVS
jgi:crossover junction endodeoxyribonuclease RuvC